MLAAGHGLHPEELRGFCPLVCDTKVAPSRVGTPQDSAFKGCFADVFTSLCEVQHILEVRA